MMKRSSLLMTAALALAGQAGLADAADVAAGQAKVDAVCAECHEAADWQGTGEAERSSSAVSAASIASATRTD